MSDGIKSERPNEFVGMRIGYVDLEEKCLLPNPFGAMKM